MTEQDLKMANTPRTRNGGGNNNGQNIPHISKRWKEEGPVVTDSVNLRKLKPQSTEDKDNEKKVNSFYRALENSGIEASGEAWEGED